MLLQKSWVKGLIALAIIGCSDPSEFRGSNAQFNRKSGDDAAGHREKNFLLNPIEAQLILYGSLTRLARCAKKLPM